MVYTKKIWTSILLIWYLFIPIDKILENLAFNIAAFSMIISFVLNLNKIPKKILFPAILMPCIFIFILGLLFGAKYIQVPDNIMLYKQIITIILLIFIYKDDWINEHPLDVVLTHKGLRGLQIGTFFLVYIYFNM